MLQFTYGNLKKKTNKRLNISFSVKRKNWKCCKRNKIKRRLRNIINDAVKKC